MTRRTSRLGAHALWLITACGALPSAAIAHDEPANTAGDRDDAGIFRFNIRDDQGELLPARLTFVTADDLKPDLFPNTQADPDHLAVRLNVVYTLPGEGAITVPPGEYTVYASRGMEWSLDSTQVTIVPGVETEWSGTLVREVDTTGWVTGDFHLHTLTYSGHGDSNLPERVISLIAEGVEFAVATDHNHNTDYEPTIEHLGAHEHVTAVVGNEVSTPIGHFNAFPLDPDRPVVPARLGDANILFKIIRDEPNGFGIRPVIQLNHPRWASIDYFGQTGLDPATGRASEPTYSDDFDSIEIFNENEGWGYYQAGIDPVPAGESVHSVLEDWFNLLNLGHTYAAVGNSDSHTVHEDFAGFPMNFVRSSTDDPGRIDPVEIAGNIRDNRLFTTSGPFLEFGAGGADMGGMATTLDGSLDLDIRIQAASWISVDRVKIVLNGDVIETIPVESSKEPVRLDITHTIPVHRDGWVSLLVEGDTSLSPILPDQGRAILPLAVSNPVWIDTDGDGKSRPVAVWARTTLATAGHDEVEDLFARVSPAERAQLVLGAFESSFEKRDDLIVMGLRDEHRRVRLAAARATEKLASPGLLGELNRLWEKDVDAYLRVVLLQAMNAVGDPYVGTKVMELVRESSAAELAASGSELDEFLPGEQVRGWSVVGYFPCPERSILDTVEFGPEQLGQGEFETSNDRRVSWSQLSTRPDGYLDLTRIDPTPGAFENVIAYAQVYIFSEIAQEIPFAMGTDDGCVLWVNSKRLHTDLADHGATPMQHVGQMQLNQGWNRVLVKVANGGGGFGLYFRPIADGLRTSATIPND